MNIKKRSSLMRLIAFFLVAIILVCTYGFTTDGWNISDSSVDKEMSAGQNSPSSGNGNTVELPSQPVVTLPKYISFLTGLETTEELYTKRPEAFIISTDSPLYGTSYSEILVEIPIENGRTRLMAILTDTSDLWKAGSICPTRAYISNIAKFFGSAIVSLAKDESVQYNSCDTSKDEVDLSLNKDYYYSEYTYYTYTNANLLQNAISSSGIDVKLQENTNLPFIHNDPSKEEIESNIKAENISIIYSSASISELIFSAETGKYGLHKNSVACTDLLTNQKHEYKNCFVLFADSVTYEDIIGEQTVMNTIGEGRGLYFTNGSCTEINWKSDADGNLKFLNVDGSSLIVNRGKSYIAYVKSSRTDSVIFE